MSDKIDPDTFVRVYPPCGHTDSHWAGTFERWEQYKLDKEGEIDALLCEDCDEYYSADEWVVSPATPPWRLREIDSRAGLIAEALADRLAQELSARGVEQGVALDLARRTLATLTTAASAALALADAQEEG